MQLTTIKIGVTTRSRLRRVAALTEESHMQVLERLLAGEEAWLASTPFTPEWACAGECTFMPVSARPAPAPDHQRVYMVIARDPVDDNPALRPQKNDVLYFVDGISALVETVHSPDSYTIIAPQGIPNLLLAAIIRQHAAAGTAATAIKSSRLL